MHDARRTTQDQRRRGDREEVRGGRWGSSGTYTAPDIVKPVDVVEMVSSVDGGGASLLWRARRMCWCWNAKSSTRVVNGGNERRREKWKLWVGSGK